MNHTARNILIGTAGAAGLFLASAATANADTTYKVVKNDTVWDLSQKYGVSIETIETLNRIDRNSHLIVTGQNLQIPDGKAAAAAPKASQDTTELVHNVTVKGGDSLWSIAQAENTTVDKLRSLNNLATDETLIYPGQSIKVNGAAAAQPAAQAQTSTQQAVADNSTQSAQQPDQAQQSTQSAQATQSQPAQTQQPAASQQTTQSQPAAAQQTQQSTVQVTVSANHTTHTVAAGESLWSIAQDYGVTVDSLRQSNNLGATLMVGTTLTINDPARTPAAQASSQTTAPTQTQSQPAAAQQTQTQSQPAAAQQTQTQQQSQSNQSTAQQSTQTQTQSQQTSAPAQQQTATPAASSVNGSAVAAYAQQFIGVPYVSGGKTPSGFDCSGFTRYVYAHFGKNIGDWTVPQESSGTQISVSQAQVGDLLFWGAKGNTYHVAIYLGGGRYIAAPEPGQSVKIGSTQYFQPSFAVHVN